MSDEHDQDDSGSFEREPTHHQNPWSPEAPRMTDELYEAFPNAPTPYSIDPADGLPTAQMPASVALALAPLQTVDTLICGADTRAFVIRDEWGDVIALFKPAEVVRARNGSYRVVGDVARERLGIDRKLVYPVEAKALAEATWVEVEPIRPQCKHYARQLTDFPEDPEHRFVMRLCTARRTDAGEFLSLHSTTVYACELRNPRHHESEQQLDTDDARRVAEAEARKPKTFDLEQALQNEAQANPSRGGIFSDTL